MKRARDGESDCEPIHKKVKYGSFEEFVMSMFSVSSPPGLVEVALKIERREPDAPVVMSGAGAKERAVRLREETYAGAPIMAMCRRRNAEISWEYCVGRYDYMMRRERFDGCSWNEVMLGPCKLVLDVDAAYSGGALGTALHRSLASLRVLISAIGARMDEDFGRSGCGKALILDGSRRGKLSHHVVFSGVAFDGIVQAGCYLCRAIALCPRELLEGGEMALAGLDTNIYSEGHGLRTYFSAKPGCPASRLVVHGMTEQVFSPEVLSLSLVCMFDAGDLRCARVEDIQSLQESKWYALAMERRRSLSGGERAPARRVGPPQRPSELMDLTGSALASEFFQIVGALARARDLGFTHKSTYRKRCCMSSFGVRAPPGQADPMGPSFSLEVSGPYCAVHKKFHENAKTKTYFYFPFSDEVSARKLLGERFSLERVKTHKAFRVYYRCNYRDPGARCVLLDAGRCAGSRERFEKFHRKLLAHLRNSGFGPQSVT